VCLCVRVCWSRSRTLQKRVNRSRCRLGLTHVGPTNRDGRYATLSHVYARPISAVGIWDDGDDPVIDVRVCGTCLCLSRRQYYPLRRQWTSIIQSPVVALCRREVKGSAFLGLFPCSPTALRQGYRAYSGFVRKLVSDSESTLSWLRALHRRRHTASKLESPYSRSHRPL